MRVGAPAAIDPKSTPAAQVFDTPATPTIQTLVDLFNSRADLQRSDRQWTAADTLKNVVVNLRHPDGRTSHNLFGIKAGSNWKGATVDCMTTEYVDGRMVKTVERFRAYGSYQEAFGDWAKLMANNPRYSNVLASGGSIDTFARNMQRAGYATDPNYGSKLASIITQAVSLRRVST